MITNTGKNIIAKYLLNQAPEFASHIAVGIGGNAIPTSSSVTFLPTDKSLDFEVVRVPILSKGLIKEDNVEKIVFKAQLPTDQRLQITEIGLYPSESNALAEKYDSKIISTFTNSETWTYFGSGSVALVPYNNSTIVDTSGNISITSGSANPIFYFIDSDNAAFEFSERKERNEQPRYLTKTLLTNGSSAKLGSDFSITEPSYYIENNTFNINMGNNLPTDEIKLAFSVISKTLEEYDNPDTGVRFIVKFLNNIPGSPSASAGIFVPLSNATEADKRKRYQVAKVNISDFDTDPNFSWSSVNTIRIYTSVIHPNPEEYFVALDALKIDNISTINPLYGLIAAEYLKTPDQYPVLKRENSISYIEYRFGLGVS